MNLEIRKSVNDYEDGGYALCNDKGEVLPNQVQAYFETPTKFRVVFVVGGPVAVVEGEGSVPDNTDNETPVLEPKDKNFNLTLAQCKALYFRWKLQKTQKSFQQFMSSIQPVFGGDGAIVVPWAGMWLVIETDGYTHS